MRTRHAVLAVTGLSVLMASCHRSAPQLTDASFARIHVMSNGPQQPFPDTPCGATRPTTVVRVIIPKDFLKNGMSSQVKIRPYQDPTDKETGNLTDVNPVDPNDSNYVGSRTRIDFNVKKLLSSSSTNSIIAVKIINRSDLVRFDPSGPITVAADDPSSHTAPPSKVFCGAPLYIDQKPDQEPGDGVKREIVRFYITNQSNPAKDYGYNIHMLLKDPSGDVRYDVPIVIDPKVTNYG